MSSKLVVPEATATDKLHGIEVARFTDGLYYRQLHPKKLGEAFWTPVPSAMSRYAEELLVTRNDL